MKVARLFGLALVSAMVLGAMIASTALASTPEFRELPPTTPFVTLSLTISILRGRTNTVFCNHSTNPGVITGMDTVGRVAVDYTGCTISTASCSAKVRSITGKEGEIVTNPIKGLLGTVKTSEGSSGVGILFEPETGSRFVTFASNTCTPEATANGDVAGLVTPINRLQTTDQIVLQAAGGGNTEAIKTIFVLNKEISPELESFGSISSEEATDENKFSGGMEVS